ncbi:hypothetical protein [Flagellimonas marinaquae]
MRQRIFQHITTALRNRERYFIRERDIQLYLANYFDKTGEFDKVFMEYHVPKSTIQNYLWKDVNSIYIDLVLEAKGQFYPIEIKYKTMAQQLPFSIFGQGTPITLRHHGAKNIGCYEFWKDLKRIELFEQTFQNCNRGLVLFVSNDVSYQNPPLSADVGYAAFSIHNERHIPKNTQLNWSGVLALAEGRPSFTTRYGYNITWVEMNIEQHYYILI